MNVPHFCFPVVWIAYSPVKKALLPDWRRCATKLVDAMRATALDQLHSPFQACLWPWGNQQMKMVWHQDELMQQVLALIAIPEKGFDEDFGEFGNLKHRASLPASARYEIRAPGKLPMFRR